LNRFEKRSITFAKILNNYESLSSI